MMVLAWSTTQEDGGEEVTCGMTACRAWLTHSPGKLVKIIRKEPLKPLEMVLRTSSK